MKYFFTLFYCGLLMSSFAQTPADTLTILAEATINKLDCYNDSTDITITAFGGIAPYVISWENTTRAETGNLTIDFDWFFATIAPTKGGEYRIVATDADSAETEFLLTISEPTPIEFDLTATQTSCLASSDGIAEITHLIGGTVMEDYQITWLTLPTQHGRIANNLEVGLQTVIIQDDKDCIMIDTISVTSLPEMQLQENLTMVSCPDAQDGKIKLQIQGGTAPYTFDWSENIPNNYLKNQENLAGGLYQITITDASRICQMTDSFLIEEPLPFAVEWSVQAPVCEEKVGIITIESVEHAVLPVYYSLNNLGFHDKTTFGDIEPGFHTLYLRDANGCRAEEIFQMPPPKTVFLEAGDNRLIILGDSIRLDASEQSSPFTDFSWQPIEGLSCSDCPNPLAQPLETTTYHVVATDSSGCVVADEITIWIQKNRSVYIPTAFSPDGTGLNDYFVIFGGQEVRFLRALRIYNRWGSLMFEVQGNLFTDTPDFGWNGQFDGQPMPAGTYLYEAEIEFLDGEVLPYRGSFFLMR